MKKTKTVNIAFVTVVFLIITSSGLLAGLFLLILYKVNIIDDLRPTPAVLFFVTLLASMVIGTLISFGTSKHLLKPLNDLIAATKEVSKGNFNIKVSDKRVGNELKELIYNFNNMTHDLQGIEMFRKDFINSFSHEFKTPIVSIRGFARQLQNNTLSREQREEYTKIIVSESERLANMSSNILLLTKLENQEIISDKTNYFLDEQIRNCVLLLQGKWEEKNITFNIDLDVISYYNNEEIMAHVWLNILKNAIKFTKDNGEITIKCRISVDNIRIEISDNGIGMDDETLNHIFDKFYKGDSSRLTEGNGLGLSLVKRIIELCKGSITVKSQKYEGTTFYVYLPR